MSELRKVLILGSGGREDAIARCIGRSRLVSDCFVSPGNAGTARLPNTTNVLLKLDNAFEEVVSFCEREGISLVIVGPEDPLAGGIADVLAEHGIPCFGPTAAAAKIESSKAFAKDFMQRHGIPTARYEVFSSVEKAKYHISKAPYQALVVKADGLAAGKGVAVTENTVDACAAVQEIRDKFGEASCEIVVEELLSGPEVSALCFTDGKSIRMMPLAQDHKRLLDEDRGPNTGGMGAVAPYPLPLHIRKAIEKNVLQKTVDAMRSEGLLYRGVLYAGLMLTANGPKVLEFNCRFGDPETQAILSLLDSDLFEICLGSANGSLSECSDIAWKTDSFACGIVMVSAGYPGPYPKGLEIKGLAEAEAVPGVTVLHAGTALNVKSDVVTSGGRVLAVVATTKSPETSRKTAMHAAELIRFDGAFYRKDIGLKSSPKLTYEAAGVSIGAGNEFVEQIRPLCQKTTRVDLGGGIGGFAACLDLKAAGYPDGITVISTDGVGTKLEIAEEVGELGGIGVDLVAMCVNDLLCEGAEPLQFLDYYATGKLRIEAATSVVSGIADGCVQANCVLAGGETAEMPGLYPDGKFDLAGFVLGAKSRTDAFPRIQEIESEMLVFGVPSSGVHSNGFSLVRRIVQKSGLDYFSPCPWQPTKTLGESLLTPTKVYVKSLLPLIRSGRVHSVAHITGGGLLENIPRSLPSGLGVELDSSAWNVPEVFQWIQEVGNVEDAEMWRTFNCGLGMVLIARKEERDFILKKCEDAVEIGSVVKIDGKDRVRVLNWKSVCDKWRQNGCSNGVGGKKRVAIFISGTGTNMSSLIRHTEETESKCSVELVVSDNPDAGGLEIAQAHGITTKVVHIPKKKDMSNPEALNEAVEAAFAELSRFLRSEKMDIICLAGFMRILPSSFTEAWKGALINVHPSLLPKYRGLHTHRRVLEAGDRFTGCTVHFVRPEVDAGPVIEQARIAVRRSDTERSLEERVKAEEHRIFPLALEDLASHAIRLRPDWTVQRI